MTFPRDPSVLDWARKIHKAQKTKHVRKVIARMNPPDNCTHTAYIVCLNLAAVRYTELLKNEEMAT